MFFGISPSANINRLDLLRSRCWRIENCDLTLDVAIRSTKFQHAFDPRDHVYGVLGLVRNGCCADIVPDYTASGCSVFCAAFRVIWEDFHNPLLRAISRLKKREAEELNIRFARLAGENIHKPLLDDGDGLRTDCNGEHCGSYKLCTAFADCFSIDDGYLGSGRLND